MEREYRLSARVGRVLQLQIRMIVGLGVLAFPMGAVSGDPWGGAAVTAFILVIALCVQIWLKRMNPSVVVVQREGVRYGHIPDSPLVPWVEIQSVRERHLAQRLDLVDAEGETRISLEYHLEGFAELAGLVLQNVPVARQRPVRFRRSWRYEIGILSFLLLIVVGSLWTSLWLTTAIVVLGGFLLHEESKSPYAAEVTDSALVLSFVFRRLRIPLQDLKFTSATQHHQGMLLQLLEIEDPQSEKPILIRNVGVDMIVLKATIQEAIDCFDRYSRKRQEKRSTRCDQP